MASINATDNPSLIDGKIKKSLAFNISAISLLNPNNLIKFSLWLLLINASSSYLAGPFPQIR